MQQLSQQGGHVGSHPLGDPLASLQFPRANAAALESFCLALAA